MGRRLLALLAVLIAVIGLAGCAKEKVDTAVTQVPETVFKIPGGVQAPPGSPIIVMNTLSRNASSGTYLCIYEDRSVIAVDEGQTREDLGRPGFRIWKTENLNTEQFESLIGMFRENISALQDTYRFPGYGDAETGFYTGDMDTYLKFSYQDISKTVRAYDYLSMYSSYNGGTYAGMPSPLAEICERLQQISIETLQVMKQDIP